MSKVSGRHRRLMTVVFIFLSSVLWGGSGANAEEPVEKDDSGDIAEAASVDSESQVVDKKPEKSEAEPDIGSADEQVEYEEEDSKGASKDDEGESSIGEIVVTGTRVETERMNVPADVQVVGEDRLKRPGTKSALNALSGVSGVKMNPRQEAATFTDIEVRGLTSNSTSGGNVLIMLDGIPQRRLSFGGPYMGALPYDSINKMELVKGPMSALYGRNSMAGALQLFSDPGSPERTFDFTTSYEYPSNNAHASVKTAGPVGKNPIGGNKLSTYSLTGSFNYATGWQPSNETVKGDAYLHVDLNLSDDDKLTILAGFFTVDEEAVAPVFVDENGERLLNFDRDTNLGVPDQNSLAMTEYRVAARYERDWLKQLQSKLTFAYWHGDTFWKVGRPGDQPSEGSTISRSASNREFTENSLFTELELIGRYEGWSWLKGSVDVGASYEYLSYVMKKVDITTKEAFEATGGYKQGVPIDWYLMEEPGFGSFVMSDQSQRDTYEHDAGVFLRKQFAFFDRVYLHGGFRFDYFDRSQENPDTDEEATHDDWALSPSVGVNVAVLKMDNYKLNVYGNWGRGFAPIFRAVNNTQFADVDSETSESFDVGVKTRLLDSMIEASLVFYQLERKDIVAMNSETSLQENVGNWRIRGVETDIKVRPIKELAVYTSYAWRDPQITDFYTSPEIEGNKIRAMSDHSFTGGVEGLADFGLGGGTEVRYVSSFYGNDQNSFELPEYVLWDAWLFYDWKGKLRTSVYVKNILDQEYFTAVFNGIKKGSAFEGLPRSYGVSLTGHF